jgi:hypothetical protein
MSNTITNHDQMAWWDSALVWKTEAIDCHRDKDAWENDTDACSKKMVGPAKTVPAGDVTTPVTVNIDYNRMATTKTRADMIMEWERSGFVASGYSRSDIKGYSVHFSFPLQQFKITAMV